MAQCNHLYPSVYPRVYPSVYPRVYPRVYPSVYPSLFAASLGGNPKLKFRLSLKVFPHLVRMNTQNLKFVCFTKSPGLVGYFPAGFVSLNSRSDFSCSCIDVHGFHGFWGHSVGRPVAPDGARWQPSPAPTINHPYNEPLLNSGSRGLQIADWQACSLEAWVLGGLGLEGLD